MIRPDRIRHPRTCRICGSSTYRKGGVCKRCDYKAGAGFPDPKFLPEPYLQRCAEELLRRHVERAKLLIQLGVRAA